jgi:hypothetical protein
MDTMDTRLTTPWWALRLGIGLTASLAGLDKFFNLLADWTSYISPAAEALLPMSPQMMMGIVGVVELAVGLAILTTWTRVGALVAAGWLFLVAVNLALGGFLDIAVRDVVMVVAAFTLARLTAVREGIVVQPAAAPARALHRQQSV